MYSCSMHSIVLYTKFHLRLRSDQLPSIHRFVARMPSAQQNTVANREAEVVSITPYSSMLPSSSIVNPHKLRRWSEALGRASRQDEYRRTLLTEIGPIGRPSCATGRMQGKILPCGDENADR